VLVPDGDMRYVDAERMVTDARVAFFSFIGSAKVGWLLRSKLAPGTRCALEHGGVAPVILGADADLDRAIPALVKGGYYHAGQVCVSVQRIFADARVRAEVIERMKQAVEALIVGDPADEKTEVGPLIQPGEVTRIDEWVKEAAAGGAAIVTGGKAISKTAYTPTVLDRPSDSATISTCEVFGPVTCVYEYDDVEDAIRRANALPFAFQAAVFAQDIDFALKCADRLAASAVMINDHTAFRVDWMPFAGLKLSGYGVGGIGYTMHDMTYEKMTVIKSTSLGG
jgi:acyl-CoA reductase-like NAD-dependent aldehyde dehydrogenase